MDWSGLAYNLMVPGVSLVEKVARPVIVYLLLLLGLRLFGRRELAQLSSGDLIVLLLLSNTVQNAIIGNDNSLAGGVVGAAALLAVNDVVRRLRYANPRWARLIEGQPIVLVRDGRMVRPELRHLILTEDELTHELRRQGATSLADVHECTLDQNGRITVVLRKNTGDARVIAPMLERISREVDRIAAQQHELIDELRRARPS